ncbi:MAG: beta strand repeat-containing protein, partial [Planctomycetaceae bacterium]
MNGTLYFMANDGTNGYELWKSDGTSSGTVLVKDIRGGGGNSYPRYLRNQNGTLYFQANDGTNGHELWKSDGTSTGTVLVKDIRVGGGNSNPFDLTEMNGTLYFRAYDLINGVELWKSDGTSSGTVVVKDIRAGLSGSYPYSLTNVNGTLFFKADDGTNGQELWKTDGTSSGTVLVKNIRSRHYDSNLQYLTNVNGTLFFQANDGTNGRELWKSDGTSSGTVLVKDIMYVNSYPQFLTNLNGTLYFRANDGTNGRELWKSDGTSTGTVLVKNIQTGGKYSDSSPYGFIQINGTSYFRANDGIHGSELWKTDGTSTGTVLVKDLQAGVSGSHPNFFTDVNGTLYFSASSGTHSFALWRVIEEVSNSAPTNITLSASSVAENQPSGTAVGSFSTTDPDVGDTFTYALVAGDVADFQIVGSELRSNRAFDFETKSSYSVTVRTTDAGGRTFDKIFTISVADLLEISAGADLGAKEGDLVALGSGAYNGPVPTSLLTLQIDWGDGTIEPGVLVPVAGTNGGTIANSHRYVDEGSYTITLTLSDGTSTIVDSLIASVANAAPAVGSLSGPAAAVRGQLVAYRVLFTDAGIADTQTASIDWGDGTSTPGTVAQAAGAGTVNGSHIYTATGIYTVTVTVTDNDGGATSQTRNVTIASANLQVSELDPTKTDLFVGGTTSNDTIAVALSGTNTTVTINTVSVGSFAPTGRIVIFGQAGNDNVTVASTITRAAWLYGDDDNDTLTGGGGNDVLVGGTGADSQIGGAGNDTYTFDSDTPLGVDTVNDSVGTDTIDFTATTSQAIALNLGLITAQGVNANLTLTLTSASAIENVTGGSLADTLTGNALTNLLVGGPGNDTLIGAAGNDTSPFDRDETLGADTLHDAGGGLDTLDFSPTTGIGATVDLSLATVQTIATGRLTLVFGSATTVETIIGGANNDSLTGNTLANTLTGGPGSDSLDGSGNNDSLIGGVGDDTLTGGMGNDSYIYAANTALGSDTLVELAGEGTDLITFATTTTKGVVLNLGLTTTQTAVTGNLNVTLNAADTFENVIGGSLADRLTGNLLGNLLLGGPGKDTLAGAAGNDVYSYSTSIPLGTDTLVEVVGEGADMLVFSLTTTLAVVVNLNMATTQLVNANLSLVLGAVDTFENVSGGSLNDTLTGNALTNRLVGNAGLDTLVAGAGNDTLDGGLGNDNLQGGTDNDTYLLDADLVLGTDTLTELADGGTDTLDFSQTTGKALVFNLGSIAAQTVVASNLTLTLSSADTFENVIGGTLNDTVTGNALANRLDGNAGNDTLQGLAGDDMLIGGLGNDSFVFCTDFALGIDTLDESAGGLDTLDFATSSTLG